MDFSSASSTWALAQAKAKLSELIRATKIAPQIISSDGTPAAVVVNFAEYETLMRLRKDLILQRRRASLSVLHEINLSEKTKSDFVLPERVERKIPQFEDDK